MTQVNLKIYRQTFNETLQRWNVPKRKDVLQADKFTKQRKHRWLAIKNAEVVKGKGKPYFQALMKIKEATDAILDELKRPVWKTVWDKPYAYFHKSKGHKYAVFTLICQRVDYRDSIHGGMR
jgi:hypothetical protein